MTNDTKQAIATATQLLAKAKLLDPRMSVDESTILAWAELIAPHKLSLADALPAVVLHYSTSIERIMPADVLRIARERRRDDQARHVTVVDPDQAPASIEARKAAIAQAVASIGRAHDADRGDTFASIAPPARIESDASRTAKVARARASGPPAPMPADHAEVVQ